MARATVADHLEHVSSFVLDATQPLAALSFLQYKVFLVYISNVYDNLPTDEVAHLGGRTYLNQVRAYLPRAAAGALAERVGASPAEVPAVLRKLLKLGPELASEAMPLQLPTVDDAVEFWRQAWAELRLAERYVPIGGLDLYQVAPDVDGEMLRPFLESGEDIRMHVNNGTVASFVDTLRLIEGWKEIEEPSSEEWFGMVSEAYELIAELAPPGRQRDAVMTRYLTFMDTHYASMPPNLWFTQLKSQWRSKDPWVVEQFINTSNPVMSLYAKVNQRVTE